MSARDPNIGKRVGGRFLLERPLGAGGVGKVYEALQEDLGRKVAVKLVRSELASEPEVLERFRREARAVAALAHPHIAQVLAYGEPSAREPAFIAFELVRGTSLAELLHHEGRFTAERTVRLTQQVLAGLAAAHQAGIVHRDLKPGNIFVANVAGVGEMAKLLDFGIAQVHDGQAYKRITATGATVGTPRYMSPEQLTGKVVDARSDLWSLGVVMYRMLAGRPPFDGNPGDILMAIHTAEVPSLPSEAEVPPQLAAVVMRALEKDPERRWRSAAAMAAALESASLSTRAPARSLAAFDDVTDRVTSPGHAVLPDGATSSDMPSLPIARPSDHSTLPSARPTAPMAPLAPLAPSPMIAATVPADATLLPSARRRSGMAWMVIAAVAAVGSLVAIPLLLGSQPSEPAPAAGIVLPEPPRRSIPTDAVAEERPPAVPSLPLPTRGTLRSYLARALERAEGARLAGLEAAFISGETGVVDLSAEGATLTLDLMGADGLCRRYVARAGGSEVIAPSHTCGRALISGEVDPAAIITAGRDACDGSWGEMLTLTVRPDADAVRATARDGEAVVFSATLTGGTVRIDRDSCARRRRRATSSAERPIPGVFRPVPADERPGVNNPWDE